MIITDFFIQGCAGLRGDADSVSLKARLDPLVTGLAPVRSPLFVELLRALMYEQSFDPASRFAQMPEATVRVGCVFASKDGSQSYRVIRDLKTGAAQLAKAEAGQFVPVASSAREVSQLLRSELRLCADDVFSAVFVLDASALPEVQAQAVVAPPPAPLGLALPEARHGRSAHEITAELNHWKAQRNAQQSVQQLEFELDGLQKRRFQFDELAEKRRGLGERLAAFDRELQHSAALDELPADFAQLVAQSDKLNARYKEERARLQDELAVLDERGEPPKPEPLWRDAKFIGGIAGGAALLLGASFLNGDLRLLGLLDIAPFGLAAVQALGVVNELEDIEAHRARRTSLGERLRKLEVKYSEAVGLVKAAVARFNVERPEEILALQQRRAQLSAERVHVAHALEAFDAGEGQRLHGDELKALSARIAEVEELLLSAGQGADNREADRRIAELEAELRGGAVSGAIVTPRGVGQAALPSLPANVGAPPPFERLLLAVADATGASREAAAQQLSHRATEYAQRLLGDASSVVAVDVAGDAQLGGAPLAALAAAAHALAVVAVRFAAIELVLAKTRGVVVVDRLHEGLAALGISADALAPYYAHLGQQAQVLVLAADASLLGATSSVVTV